MREIIIMNQPPVIFTKDRKWLDEEADHIKLEPGALICLPEDAVLYEPPLILDSPQPPNPKKG